MEEGNVLDKIRELENEIRRLKSRSEPLERDEKPWETLLREARYRPRPPDGSRHHEEWLALGQKLLYSEIQEIKDLLNKKE